MAETASADTVHGAVTLQSPQEDPTPKSVSDKESETTEPESKPKRSKITSKVATTKAPERDSRGVVKTQWDNPAADPNLRKHIGEDPTGESNEIPEPK